MRRKSKIVDLVMFQKIANTKDNAMDVDKDKKDKKTLPYEFETGRFVGYYC